MADAQDKITISANGQSRSIVLADTEAARELKALLANSPVIVRMNDYGGFEKVGQLPWQLSADDRHMDTEVGDVVLYLGDNIVVFYGANSWSYTPIGKIKGATYQEIKDFLSGEPVGATLSIGDESGLDVISADASNSSFAYTLQGEKVNLTGRGVHDLPAGIYIMDGKKYKVD